MSIRNGDGRNGAGQHGKVLTEPAAPPADEPNGAPADAAGTLRLLCDSATELSATLRPPVHRIALRAGDCALELEFAVAGPAAAVTTGPAPLDRTDPAPPGAGTATPVAAIAIPPNAPEPPAGSAVRAPLVGTFYAAPSPGSDPFVQVGDLIRAGQPVAIIEAMKLMNRVEADHDGVVLEVLVADGEAVEYDQPLLVLGAADSAAAEAAGGPT